MARASRLVIAGVAFASVVCACLNFGELSGGESAIDSGALDGATSDAISPIGDAAATCDADLANDEGNCGRCGRSCFGGGCEAGLCGFVEVDDHAVNDVDYKDGTLYFTRQFGSGDGGGVSSYVVSSGETFNIADGLVVPGAISASPPYVMWATGRSFVGDRQITRMLIDGGAPTTIVDLMSTDVLSMASNSTNVFWVDNSNKQVDYAPIATGGGLTLFDGLSNVSANNIAFLCADDAHVVVAGNSNLEQVVLSNNAIVNAPDVNPGYIVASSTVIYFNDGNSIYRVAPGATARTLVATVPADDGGANNIAGLAGDDNGVYWVVIEGDVESFFGCSDAACSSGPTTISPPRTCKFSPYISDMIVAPDTLFISGVCDPTIGSALFRIAR